MKALAKTEGVRGFESIASPMSQASNESELLLRLYLEGPQAVANSGRRSHTTPCHVALLKEGLAGAQNSLDGISVSITDRGRTIVEAVLFPENGKGRVQ